VKIEDAMNQEADFPGQYHRDVLLRLGADLIRQCRAANDARKETP